MNAIVILFVPTKVEQTHFEVAFRRCCLLVEILEKKQYARSEAEERDKASLPLWMWFGRDPCHSF